jgi:hypothetical protein
LDTYHVVLYIHLLALFVGIGAAAVLLACLLQLRVAETLEAAVPWGAVAGRTEKAFPIAILGLFGSGAYMTSDVWTWGTGWIDVSIAGLVYVSLNGPLVGGRTAHKLKHALMQNGPGPLSAEARRVARHPGLWVAELTNVGVVLAIVWNMTQKPGTWTAVLAVVVGWAVGAAAGYRMSRLPIAATAAPEPAG